MTFQLKAIISPWTHWKLNAIPGGGMACPPGSTLKNPWLHSSKNRGGSGRHAQFHPGILHEEIQGLEKARNTIIPFQNSTPSVPILRPSTKTNARCKMTKIPLVVLYVRNF
jgi:hypothetical protein